MILPDERCSVNDSCLCVCGGTSPTSSYRKHLRVAVTAEGGLKRS